MTDANQAWQERYTTALMNTFGPPKLVLTRGEGAHVWDENGTEYLDLLGGIAVNSLGHNHPALVEAVTEQLRTLGHISNFFASEPQVRLAEKLLRCCPRRRACRAGRVFFANSGAEANEAALKLTRRTGRTHLVAAEGGFHGRTMGALALTSKEAYREPFEPLPGDVTFVPYGDADALAAAVTDRTAAIVLEPIQGEAGVEVPPDGYLRAARDIATEHGALLWLDEVQTGVGRTGRWFAHETSGVTADIVTVAKGLGGGFPIGACIGLGPAATLFEPGNHGTTFGGNPVACAAALCRHRDHRVRRAPRARHRARPEAARRPGRRPAGDRGARRGPADRARPDRRRLGRRHRGRPAARLHHQQPDPEPDPAGAAAGPDRRRRRGLPRRLAGHPRRRDGGSEAA